MSWTAKWRRFVTQGEARYREHDSKSLILQAHVLYGRVEFAKEGEPTLQAVADAIKSEFVTAGLMENDNAPVLLHATLINTRHGTFGQWCGG